MKSPILGYESADSPTFKLATLVASTGYESIPEEARERGKDLLLDSIASAIAGRHGDETAQITSAASAAFGPGQSTVIGSTPLSTLGAVMVNGYQVTAVTLCDMHVAALNHVTPAVVSSALGAAQSRQASGAELVRSVILGLETSVRIGQAINFEAFRERGWHAPGVIGPFGAAAAVSSILGLDRDQTINAFGLAGSQSAGTYAAWGTPTVKFHQTRGGVSGTLAAFLASTGFISSQDILTHPDGGIFNTYSDGGTPATIIDGLGSEWRFDQINLRRWPAATQFQSIIEALFTLIAEHDVETAGIDHVRVELPPDVYGAFGGFGWEDKFNARLSPRWVAAAVLTDRRCWIEQFETERLADVDLTAFAAEKVVVDQDPDIPGVGARITVEAGGSTYTASCPVPLGDASRPLPRSEIIGKFHDARDGIMSDAAAESFVDAILALEEVDDVTALIGQLGQRD